MFSGGGGVSRQWQSVKWECRKLTANTNLPQFIAIRPTSSNLQPRMISNDQSLKCIYIYIYIYFFFSFLPDGLCSLLPETPEVSLEPGTLA